MGNIRHPWANISRDAWVVSQFENRELKFYQSAGLVMFVPGMTLGNWEF